MANWPPVNLSDLAQASHEALENQATGFNYEPGSTFKAFTVSAALEERLITPESSFTLPPTIRVGEPHIEDAEQHGTETMSVAEILARSSNVGAVDDRAAARRDRISAVDRKLRLRPPDRGRRSLVRNDGIVPKLERLLGRDDGQPADGPGRRR